MSTAITVTRTAPDELRAVVRRDGDEPDREIVGADLFALMEQVVEDGESVRGPAWSLPEGLRIELTGANAGRWLVSTWHTTKFLLDLDARTITRIPGPQPIGNDGRTAVNHHADDGVAAHVFEVVQCHVGTRARIVREYPWAPEEGDLYLSSTVRHIGQADSGMWVLEGGEVMTGVHDAGRCAGRNCVVHDPSDHSLRGMPLIWRADCAFFERRCEHGIGHPDPDSVAYAAGQGDDISVHGCDGCCVITEANR